MCDHTAQLVCVEEIYVTSESKHLIAGIRFSGVPFPYNGCISLYHQVAVEQNPLLIYVRHCR